MKFLWPVYFIVSLFSLEGMAQNLAGHYVCPPTLNCRFSDFEFITTVGKTYFKGKLISDDGIEANALMEMKSATEGDGTLSVNYTDGNICSFLISITVEKVAKGYKVVSRSPVTFPNKPKYGQCPHIEPTLEVNVPIYFDEATNSRIDSVQHLDLLNFQEQDDPNLALAGTWRLSTRYINTCNPSESSADPGILEKLQIKCDANNSVAQIWRDKIEPIKDGCYTSTPDQVITPLAFVSFPSDSECRKFISELREKYKNQPCNFGNCTRRIFTYESGFVFIRDTLKIIAEHDLINGNF